VNLSAVAEIETDRLHHPVPLALWFSTVNPPTAT
jgi:hypothetical protein